MIVMGLIEINDKDDLEELTEFFDEVCSRCDEFNSSSCCKTCATSFSYATNSEQDIEILIDIADQYYDLTPNNEKSRLDNLKEKYEWDEEEGFLKENGCVVSRQNRPTACLTYLCGDGREYFREKYDMAIDLFLEDLFEAITDFRNEEYIESEENND